MAAAQSFGAGLSPPNAAVSICSHTFAQASLSTWLLLCIKQITKLTKTNKKICSSDIYSQTCVFCQLHDFILCHASPLALMAFAIPTAVPFCAG
jgi:hypothetical protein